MEIVVCLIFYLIGGIDEKRKALAIGNEVRSLVKERPGRRPGGR